MPPDAYLTAEDVAQRLGVSIHTVGKRVRTGDFPCVRIGPEPRQGVRDVRPVRFTEDQLDEIEARYFHHVPARGGVA